MNPFLWGATAMACATIGLLFLRTWRHTDDRFFALFGSAFWILAMHWSALAIFGAVHETQHYFYLIRLLAFVVVIAAIAEKNRSPG